MGTKRPNHYRRTDDNAGSGRRYLHPSTLYEGERLGLITPSLLKVVNQPEGPQGPSVLR
jgi:hypothetical protein